MRRGFADRFNGWSNSQKFAISAPAGYPAGLRTVSTVIRSISKQRWVKTVCRGIVAATVSLNSVFAATIDVTVVDPAGNPVPDVVILAESATDQPLSLAAGQQTEFEMDQRQLMFDPYIMVVPVGAAVSFLNSDTTAHHVYSFSKTNRFTLPLHKGRVPTPVLFESPGVVTLGCNIHDHMVGYIVVAESHMHTQTNAKGNAQLTVDGATDDIRIRIWSPRIRDKADLLVKETSGTAPVQFKLAKKLRPAYRPQPMETSEWDDY